MANSSRKSPVVPPEVRELIEESQKIQGWVERLSEHADEARPEVYQRVLADYQGRLEKVTGRLVKHRADLVSNLESHEADVAALRGDRDGHQAELEEARLRHVVGEFDDEEWDARRGRIETSIEEIDGQLEVRETAVAELAEIISSIGEGGAPAVKELVETARDRTEPPKEGGAAPAAAAPEKAKDGKDGAGTTAGPKPAAEARTPAWMKAQAEKERAGASGSAKGEPAEAGAEAEGAKDRAPAGESTSADESSGVDSRAKAGAKSPPEVEDDEGGADYLDELEFLESLSLDEAERFDAVSAMLDDDEGGGGNGKKES